MAVFTCTQFRGVFPVGVAAVIVARDRQHAADLLNEELDQRRLPQDKPVTAEHMVRVKSRTHGVTILADGDY